MQDETPHMAARRRRCHAIVAALVRAEEMRITECIINSEPDCITAAGEQEPIKDLINGSAIVKDLREFAAEQLRLSQPETIQMPSPKEVIDYIDKGVQDATTEPSEEHIQAAHLLANFTAHGRPLTTGTMRYLHNSSVSFSEYRKIVDFLSSELRHDHPKWKESLLFSLTGRSHKYQ